MTQTIPESKPEVSFDDFAKIDLRVARVVEATDHPDADRLLVLKLDDGTGEPRQICAGVKGYYAAEELVGKLIVIVANLASRTIRGQASRGMLLAASEGTKDASERQVVLLTPMSDVAPGSTVS